LHIKTEELFYSTYKALTNILAIENTLLNLNVQLFHNALYYITLFINLVSGQYAAQCFNVCLPALFVAAALISSIHKISWEVFIYGTTEIVTNTKYIGAMVQNCRSVTLKNLLVLITDECVHYIGDVVLNKQ